MVNGLARFFPKYFLDLFEGKKDNKLFYGSTCFHAGHHTTVEFRDLMGRAKVSELCDQFLDIVTMLTRVHLLYKSVQRHSFQLPRFSHKLV